MTFARPSSFVSTSSLAVAAVWLRRRVPIALVFISLCSTVAAEANDKYVTSVGAGAKDGSDWSNACDGFTGLCAGTILVRGDTYYVADGDYSADGILTLYKAASGTTRIIVKKAIESDHGSSVGWASAMGDG